MSATDHPPPSLAAEEEAFRLHLDERGLLHPAARLAPPARSASYAVFAQATTVELPLDALKQQARRFFATRIGLTVEKRYDPGPPRVDAARVVVASDDATARGTRMIYGRPVELDDLAAAEAAEAAVGAGASGLAQLARRCPTVWLIVPSSDDDRAALTLAAIFASVMLGPVLAPGGREIFGVRTARLKLEAAPRPYR